MTRAKPVKAIKPLKCIRSLTGFKHSSAFLPQNSPVCTDKGVFVPSFFMNVQKDLAYSLVMKLRAEKRPWPKDHECGLDVIAYVPDRMGPAKLSALLALVVKAGEGVLWVRDDQVVQANIRVVQSQGLDGRAVLEIAVCLYPGTVKIGRSKTAS